MSYTTVLFDADGTLLDFAATEKKALANTFAKHHIPWTTALKTRYHAINQQLWNAYEEGQIERKQVLYTRFTKLFQEFGIQVDGQAFEDIYQEELGKGHDLIPHAMEVVKNLYGQVSMVIVTNGVVATQYSRLRDSGLDQYMDAIFISEEIGYRKPQKEYFLHCFQHIKEQDTSKLLLVGDSLSSDIQGGYNAQLTTCWFHQPGMVNTKGLPMAYDITDLRRLYDILNIEKQ